MSKVARAALVASFLLLNLYLAWASFMLRAFSPPLYAAVNHAIRYQDIAIWKALDLVTVTYYTQVVADFEALVLLAVLVVSTARLSRGQARGAVAVRCTQVAALCFVILGAEVAVFDYKEFYLHFTDAVLVFNLATWFTNADLLVASLSVIGVTMLLRGPLARSRLNSLVALAVAVAVVATVVGAAYLLLPVTSITTTTTFADPSHPASALVALLRVI